MASRVRVIGIHPLATDEPVHLVELEADDDYDFGKVSQEIPGQPRCNWQTPYDEREIAENRFVFFFHYLDIAKPLQSPAGPLLLPAESPVPHYLQCIEYKQS